MLFDHAALARNRRRAAPLLPAHAVLLAESAADILERLAFTKHDFPTILLLDAREDGLAAALQQRYPASTITQSHTDAEALPFAPASFDLVVSQLALHWVNDVATLLLRLRFLLKPNGFFIASLVGGDSLHELRHALATAELTLRGGTSPHIAPFIHGQDAGRLLQQAGFALPVADRQRLTLTYPDIFALMHELRFMGEANALTTRDRRFMPKALFHHADTLYKQHHPAPENRIAATFELLFLAGWQQEADIKSGTLPP